MPIDFNKLIDGLHDSTLKDSDFSDSSLTISIDEKRKFVVPKNYNTVIAYENDVNSQIITFDCPAQHENHDLTQCKNKKLRWKNLSSLMEGMSDLVAAETASDDPSRQLLQWVVPADAFTQAGKIEISISLFDRNDNGKLVFAWNTASCSDLSVGSTLASVDSYYPANDEILTIDVDSRNIAAPKNYNNVVAYRGDIGVAKVYFAIKRYINGLDLLNTDNKIKVYYSFNDVTLYSPSSNIDRQEFVQAIPDRDNEGMVLLTWNLPDEESELVQIYYGKFSISLMVSNEDDSVIWQTGKYTSLEIKDSLSASTPEAVNQLVNANIHIDGDKIATEETLELSGVASLRTIQSLDDFNEKYSNEIMPYYDENGNYQGIYIKTKPVYSGKGDNIIIEKESELIPITHVDIERRISEIEEFFDTDGDGTFDQIREALDTLLEIDRKFASLDLGIDQIEENIDQIEENIDQIEENIGTISDAKEAETVYGAINKETQARIDAVASIQEYISELDLNKLDIGRAYTLAFIQQENGNVTAEAIKIEISHDQISDFDSATQGIKVDNAQQADNADTLENRDTAALKSYFTGEIKEENNGFVLGKEIYEANTLLDETLRKYVDDWFASEFIIDTSNLGEPNKQ